MISSIIAALAILSSLGALARGLWAAIRNTLER